MSLIPACLAPQGNELMGSIVSLLLLLLLLVALVHGRNSSRVELGAVLRPPGVWRSPTSSFGFGFHKASSDSVSDSSMVVGIRFLNISDNEVVWSAAAVKTKAAASLTLAKDGNMVLREGDGRVVWQSHTAHMGVGFGEMEDSGNFVLRDGINGSLVWESFANPTHTLLVGQTLKVGSTLTNPPYSLSLDPSSANLTLKWRGNITYWNMGASLPSSKEPDPALTASLSSHGLFSINNVSGSQLWVARSSDYSDSSSTMRKVKLDSDGNFRSYSWVPSSASWHIEWSAVQDQCLVYGWCGNYGLCIYNDSGPSCICPSADFVPKDSKYLAKGCKRLHDFDFGDCSTNQSMVKLEHTVFLSYPPESDDFFGGITDCQQNCLKSASCIAATVLNDGSGMCRFKTSNFSTGYQSITIPSTSFVKVCGATPALHSPSDNQSVTSKRKSRLSIVGIVIAVLGTLLFLVFLETCLWWVFCRNNPRFESLTAQYTLLEYASGAPVQFTYKELKQSTRNFKEKVGSGGFGTVYKGTLPGRNLVAVKKLEGIAQGDKQFRMEVATISSTHHLHLVRLIGFCSEGRHRLLVYEYMKNTSLDTFLFASPEKSKKLDWEARLNISLGTARGIAYLHEECRDCIIHCDIKPENILLDDSLNAKVSDFGLAKLNNARDLKNHTMNSVHGTRGYLAPEWLANLPITSKSDVFSYGMVLLEIVSGRRNFDVSLSSAKRKFSTWAYDEFEKGNLLHVIDKNLDDNVNLEQAERVLRISFWCIQEQPSQRPSMGKVVKMLEGVLPVDKPPSPKSFDGLQSSTSINASVSASGSMTSVFATSAPPVSSSSSADVFLSGTPLQVIERTTSMGTSVDNNLSA